MSAFGQLVQLDEETWVAPRHVAAVVRRAGESTCKVFIAGDGEPFEVEMSVEAVLSRLASGGAW